jgi:hypothetical protein
MRKLSGLFIILSLFTITAFAQSNDEKAVATQVEVMRKAMIDGNKANLTKIAADELSYGHSNGNMQNKKQFVDALVSGASDFVTIDLKGQSIHVEGNTAIVRHNLYAKTNDGGKPGSTQLGVLMVWKKISGQWKLIARQAYKLLPTPAK